MKESVNESLEMVLTSSGQPKFIISEDKSNFNQTKVSEIIHEFPERLIDPQEDVADKADDENEAWTTIKFHTAIVISETDLKNCKIDLNVSSKMQLSGKAELMQVIDVPEALLKKAEIQQINNKTFELIQLIQAPHKNKEDKMQAFDKLKLLDRSLETKMTECMRIKDRELKKSLIGQIVESKNRSGSVLTELRKLADLSQLSNETIAKLNDLAYKAIKQGGLKKLVDKRALQNEDLYKRLDKETTSILKTFDFDKIQAQNQQIISDIGDCPLSVSNTLELMQEGDCMCIGLKISRPEAAIADPSRLIIQDVVPTFMSVESFLQSAQFSISNEQNDPYKDVEDAHGGFNAKGR